MNLAPIILFVYNRPNHTKRTIEALKLNFLAIKSDLYIYSDGPKNETAKEEVLTIRKLIKEITGFKTVSIIEREKNLGLSASIISGVTEVINKFEKVIVLEDDLITSPYFLNYMNDALEIYKDVQEVISIHAYIYPIKEELPEYFFLKGADCWGWATWKRGWELFEENGQRLLKKIRERNLVKRFDFYNTYPYTKMLEEQVQAKNNSWAIKWYASALIKEKFTLYPGVSFISNIGNDSSGTHKANTSKYVTNIKDNYKKMEKIPVIEDLSNVEKVARYFSDDKTNIFKRILSRLKLL